MALYGMGTCQRIHHNMKDKIALFKHQIRKLNAKRCEAEKSAAMLTRKIDRLKAKIVKCTPAK